MGGTHSLGKTTISITKTMRAGTDSISTVVSFNSSIVSSSVTESSLSCVEIRR